jgi:DNA-binding LacI/PurR family transcriptional regulator
MSENVTIKDIAQRASVSVGTVSRVFNQHRGVHEDVRELVIRTAAELGYVGIAGRYARQKIPSTLKKIFFLLTEHDAGVPGTRDFFWSQILHGVQSEARHYNCKVSYLGIGEFDSLKLCLEQMRGISNRAILLAGASKDEIAVALRNMGCPLVLIDNYWPNTAADSILSDGYNGAYEAVTYLIECGHRSIAYIGGPLIEERSGSNAIYSIALRSSGYRNAHIDRGIPLCHHLQASSDLTPEGGYAACHRLLDTFIPFTALFCANDKVAIGAMKALHDRGIAIPDDCSVIGFDDIEFAKQTTPPLTTVRVYKEVMGAIAVRTLIARVENPDTVGTTSLVPVQMVIRNSVAPR